MLPQAYINRFKIYLVLSILFYAVIIFLIGKYL